MNGKPKRLSLSKEDTKISGSLWMFAKFLKKDLRRLYKMSSDKPGAEKICEDLLDLFDRVAGELNDSIVQDIDRQTTLSKVNAEKKSKKAKWDDVIVKHYESLARDDVKPHKRISVIMKKTRLTRAKISRTLKEKGLIKSHI